MNPTLAKTAANLKRRARRHARVPAVLVMSDERRLPDPLAVLASLPRGSGIILRHYSDPARALLAQRMADACRKRGIIFLVAGNWRLAARVGAAGVHLPEYMAQNGLPPGGRLWLRNTRRMLTVAAHSAGDLRQAERSNVSAVLLSPVFTTNSHPDRAPLGVSRAAIMMRDIAAPVIALGGVTAQNVKALRGFAGIAGIGFVQDQIRD
jgi:thiamine-phosphate pyrophosphorylase